VNLAACVTASARSRPVFCTTGCRGHSRSTITRLHPPDQGYFKHVVQPVARFAIEEPCHLSTQPEFEPVCGMRIDPERAPARLPFRGRTSTFCSFACTQTLACSPETYHTAEA
jgi:YHS domain-containing protein